ncbi:MAG: hypothetical protein QW320_10175 [Ignisphaera sp.]
MQRVLYYIVAKIPSIDIHYIDTTKKSINETYHEALSTIKELIENEIDHLISPSNYLKST